MINSQIAKDYDYFSKVVMVGDSSVGKTNLLLRFVNGQFASTHITTIGIDFKVKTLQINGKKIKIQLWDTAGQDRFRTITRTYYKGSSGIVLAYSVTDRKTFNNIESWMTQIDQNSSQDIVIIIVGNKIDCPEQQRQVTKQEGQQLAKKYNVSYFQTSAKQNIGVAQTFQALGAQIIQKIERNNRPTVFVQTPQQSQTSHHQSIVQQSQARQYVQQHVQPENLGQAQIQSQIKPSIQPQTQPQIQPQTIPQPYETPGAPTIQQQPSKFTLATPDKNKPKKKKKQCCY